MSTEAGDSSSRVSDALDEIFADPPVDTESRPDIAGPRPAPAAPPARPYELPDIVPATIDEIVDDDLAARGHGVAPPAGEPRLPSRGDAGGGRARSGQDEWTDDEPPPPDADVSWGPAPPPAGWSEGPVSRVVAPRPPGQLRRPGRRPRVRRVTRVVRHIDPWSAFKVALIFNAVGYVVALTSGVLLWRVAESTGTLDNVERWFTQFGWETFELDGGEVFHNAWIIGLFAVVAATGGAVLLVTLFNLVSDIVGGIRMTVLEEEVVERTVSATRRYVVRRPTEAGVATAAVAPDWSADDLDGAAHGRASDITEPILPDDRAAAAAPALDPEVDTAEWVVDAADGRDVRPGGRSAMVVGDADVGPAGRDDDEERDRAAAANEPAGPRTHPSDAAAPATPDDDWSID